MSDAIASHGTLVAWEGSPASGGSFTTIAELGDITPPPLTTPSTEVTPQNDGIDSYVLGVRRRGEMTFPLNFLPSGEATHDDLTGLTKGWIDKVKTGFRVTFPDGLDWIFSGFITNVASAAPAREGALSADVSIRPSGPHKIGDQIIS